MSRIDRAARIDQQFIDHLQRLSPGKPVQGRASGLDDRALLGVFDSQLQSRQLDLVARIKRQENKVFYTIGSSGHEANALVAHWSRPSDPAFLHYRSGAFMAERYRQRPDLNFIQDTCLSLAASARDPASGGRHKVWGHPELWVLPQTSTIASHLPKAFGTALAVGLGATSDHTLPVPDDSVVVCSFGDASVNHAAAQTTFNAASWAHHQTLPVPLVLVCEDNGWGISVPTPAQWVAQSMQSRHRMAYFYADGRDVVSASATVAAAIEHARQRRAPVFLHLKTVRLMGHAGTDFEIEYRDETELTKVEAQDPLLVTASAVVSRGLMTPNEVLARYEALHQQCLAGVNWADGEDRLRYPGDIAGPLAPFSGAESLTNEVASRAVEPAARAAVWGDRLPENAGPKHMAVLINHALRDLLITYPQALVFGEDVAKKGGVYTVTKGLWSTFGGRRVFNTLLDETTILGLAQGYANMGFLPIPEIQYLAYFHNACDQIRGEAASLQFFSNNRFKNPMVLRIAGLGYQKGFGGHFHNDNSVTALRDIPGLVLGCPSRGDDAVLMLRTMMALAHIDGRVCAMIEPIALYMTKDLYVPDDRGWCFDYPDPSQAMPAFEARIYHPKAKDLLIVTYGNGVAMSLRVASTLHAAGRAIRVLDLRWLKPLPLDQVLAHACEVAGVLVVDEGRPDGSLRDAVIAALAEAQAQPNVASLTGYDCYIPLGQAAEAVMVTEQGIQQAAERMLASASGD